MSKSTENPELQYLKKNFESYTYDMLLMNMAPELEEMEIFSKLMDIAIARRLNTFEAIHQGFQGTEVDVETRSGEKLHLLNFSSYNYLGFSYHPDVLKAAHDALDRYGLGAASSPVLSGTFQVHIELEKALLEYFDLPEHGISLFSSGYGVNIGVIPAFAKPGSHVLLDESAHMSLVEGAQLSGAEISYFAHNDMDDLEQKLVKISDGFTRVLICTEGVFSGDGDFGNVGEIVRLAKKYNAYTLVDEAHSALLAGPNGRGVSEDHGVLKDVDLYVMTFSKAFGGVGGAVMARRDLSRYLNWYAKSRMFSCALDPAVTGGMIKVIKLAGSEEGRIRRARLMRNVESLISKLRGKVNLGVSNSWVITVIYGDDSKTTKLGVELHKLGIDTSILQFPAVPKNTGRIRIFITSEHTEEQLQKASEIILKAAKKLKFQI